MPPVANLEPRVASLETAVQEISRGIHNIEAQIAAKNRVNWGAIIGAVGVSITLIAAIGAAWIAPIRVEMEFAKMLFAEERIKRQTATGDITTLQERNREQETQFTWARSANSAAFAENERLIRMIWSEVFKRELPALNLVPIGPEGRY
ncbi:MAG: hypothetical protein AB7I42_24290 [Bradyrhizobium sp.]|uniref:hypothetical protein n=1 Tax=Bradyrhizobium sp. TaxID=376 RepID=UPI003D0CB4CD